MFVLLALRSFKSGVLKELQLRSGESDCFSTEKNPNGISKIVQICVCFLFKSENFHKSFTKMRSRFLALIYDHILIMSYERMVIFSAVDEIRTRCMS